MLAPVSVRNRDIPGIVVLSVDDESVEDLLRLPAESLLLRWVNFQVGAFIFCV